jgi:hypothetical protein
MPETDQYSEDWWVQEILGREPRYRDRVTKTNVILALFLLSYPWLLVLSVQDPSNGFLTFVALILTSEGFVSSAILLAQWAKVSGALYFVASISIIQDNFGRGRAPLILGHVQAAARQEREDLEAACNKFLAPWELYNDPRLLALHEYGSKLSYAYSEAATLLNRASPALQESTVGDQAPTDDHGHHPSP